MHPLLPLLLGAALLPWAGVARGAEIGAKIGQAVRAADWASAQAMAAGAADPVAGKLVTFLRLMHPGDARAGEIAAFAAANPDWPNRAVLLRRRDEALAGEPDDAQAWLLCAPSPALPAPSAGTALVRCAEAAEAVGEAELAAGDARAAWVAGLPDADMEARFLARWARVLTPADEARRFAALLGANAAAAAAQLPRLTPGDRALGRARLALRGGEPGAAALVAGLPPALRDQPELVLDELRALRRAGNGMEALALWRKAGFAAEAAAGTPAFWAERAVLARQRLASGDHDGAYLLADDTGLRDPEAAAEAAFLAGFIALRRLDRPAAAATHFHALARTTSAISQARAHYWLARAAAAGHDETGARREYALAAAWPTTYYGQLANLALGDMAALNGRISALADPSWTSGQALDFAGQELVRAAATLVAWGLPGPARGFLQQVAAQGGADPTARSLEARFALDLGMPDQAVAAARRAGREGVVLIGAGWPVAAAPPNRPVPPAIALAIIRQESSFDAGAISPSGARGLMQLMPPTAALVGRQIGAAIPVDALTTDAAGNMRLGTAYLGQLIERFGGSVPLAIAAYNAGPNRVEQWLAENGDPRGAGAEAMIDWIELIGFAETRNYAQRVIESIAVYRAKRGEILPYPVS